MTVVRALNDPDHVVRQYQTEAGLAARKAVYRDVTGPDARELALEAVLNDAPNACPRGRLRRGRACRAADGDGRRGRRGRSVTAHGRADPGPRRRRARGRRPAAPIPGRKLRRRPRRVDAVPRARPRPRAVRGRAGATSRRPARCDDERRRPSRGAPRTRWDRALGASFRGGERRGDPRAALLERASGRMPTAR